MPWRGFKGESDAELAAVLRLPGWALYHLNKLGDSAQEVILTGEPLITLRRSPSFAPQTFNGRVWLTALAASRCAIT